MEPILMDVPEVLQTERLLLRVPRPGDGPRRLWMPWARPTPTVDDTETWVRRAAASFITRATFEYMLHLKQEGTFIGNCGLHMKNPAVPSMEIGYWLDSRYVGRGYMSEAVAAVERVGFEIIGAVRIQIRCDERNRRSAAVAERCGYQLEATLRCNGRGADGELTNERVYAKVRP
jgi:ribosomal-protein-serine acetyltransferase